MNVPAMAMIGFIDSETGVIAGKANTMTSTATPIMTSAPA